MNAFDNSVASLDLAKLQTIEPDRVRNTNAPDSSKFIDERQLCAELGISSVTTTKWRAKAEGPPFVKVGRLVRYRRADLEAWLVSRTVGRKCA